MTYQEPSPSGPNPGIPERVRLSGVTRTYLEGGRERPVLLGLDAVFQAGERVALVGRSGSGKSTLLHLVAGLDLPDSGEVVVEGRVLNRLAERERTLYRRRRVGLVFQFFNLVPTLTVLENLLLPLQLNGLTDEGPAWDLLEELGLGDRADSYPDRLSGGEQQRLAVARALVHRPGLVLADEPTGNLDEETGLQVMDLLERLCGMAGATMILVTHSAEVAARADRILRMHEGRLE